MAEPNDYFSDESLRRDLKGKTIRGGVATGIAQVCFGLMQIATIPILARLLTPADFGLVAMVTVVTGFAAMFVDAGLAMSAIQREKITHQQVSNLFWLAAALGVAIAAAVAVLSPAIAWFYGEPRLVPITLALAVSFIFSGLTVQHRALLRRAMQFRLLTLTQVIATGAGHIVAVYWAWRYQSYWALVLRPIVTAVLQAIGSWIACPWRPSLPRRGSGVREMAYFGFHLAGFNLINYLARNVDNLLIGWRWGAAPLGYYERAYRLLMLPLTQINVPLSNIAIPALSRLQNEPEKYTQAYEAIVGKMVYATGALVGFMLVTPDWIVRIVFGDQWLESIPIFQWLAVASARQIYINTTGWLFVSQGRSRELVWWGILGTLISVASFAIGLSYGPIGVAAAYATIPLICVPPVVFWMLGRSGPMSTWYLWKFFLHSLSVPMVIATVTYFARYLLQPKSEVSGMLMLAPIAASTAIVLMLMSRFGRRQLEESLEILMHLRIVRGGARKG